ncbi:MAG: coproporphyrinogen dehydrogenase HemZ [Lachnospiraceae bacterium]|nr:coproporphyrinogen dehydrogenase HemZ [Lachnospiraceae bacterium]
MILLEQNSNEYNNDLRAMIMAFFPGVKIVEKLDDESMPKFVFVARYEEQATSLAILDDFSDMETIEGDYLDKTTFRNKLKLASYQLLSRYSGRELPWGDLTGVRPTKIAMAELEKGKSFEDAVANYIDTYQVSEGKAKLATKVADFEKGVIASIDRENDYCLYVGIPFCPSRCLYCSFTSYPIALYEKKAAEYIETLKKEIDYISDVYKDKNLVSVYIGGGTPTSISHELLDNLLTHINSSFDMCKCREFTVEAGRPDSITGEKLMVMKKHNISRISINPQTMNDETLKVIGRAHTVEQTKEAFKLARECGFDNINMDLIAGLPGENIDSMKHTLDEIKKLSPESLTVHSLAIKRAANLKQQLGEYGDAINQDMDAMLDMVADVATELGMEPYYLYRQKNIGGNLENVGYAKKGLECLYNILIMEEITDIIAAGAGASTKVTYHKENRVERVENCKSVDDYINRFDEMLERKKKEFREG